MSECWAEGCHDEGTPRYIAKPLGSFSVAGAQLKVVATRYVLCDNHWRIVQENLQPTL